VTQHVVIVDDDDLTLKLFTAIAEEISDVVVHAFSSSIEAIDWYHGKDVDLFCFDFNMPPPNGMQMIALVRALPEFALVPIVIVTGAHEREVRYQALDLGANDFLQKPVDRREMLARFTTLLALRKAQKRLAMQVGTLERSLLDSDERSRHHADRLEALWHVANNPNLHDDALMLAMLQHCAIAIRPAQPFRGVLARIEDGTHMRILSAATSPSYEEESELPGEGTLIALSDTVVGSTLAAGGGTHAYDDVQNTDLATQFVRSLHWRAMIVTSFSAGGSSYVLTFSSQTPTIKPFGPQDRAFIEVLASFFAAHYQQRWQSARIGHQLEHDSLTGLWNRSRFRSLGRAAFASKAPAAVAVIDLVDFHRLNEAYGHLSGDAVLVEVAAALANVAREDEIVARVGSDAFGVFFPNVPSRASLLEKIERFGTAFETPMGLGDRDGKQSLHVSGRIGFALAPDDGQTLDELLLCAEGHARATGTGGAQRIFPNAARICDSFVALREGDLT
jgi:diguanylate cyclase (GGDEF)-like protein